MANNKTPTAVQQDVTELVVEARFVMRSYEQTDKNGNTVEKEYISFELVDPFGDEDFRGVALKAKWDKYDEKTNRLVRPDRVFGLMKYFARKALRQNPEVPVKVTVKPVKYKSKRSGEMVTYPAMFAAPTFVDLEDERPVEVVVKGADEANTFNFLAGKRLGISFTQRELSDYEDIGLGDNS